MLGVLRIPEGGMYMHEYIDVDFMKTGSIISYACNPTAAGSYLRSHRHHTPLHNPFSDMILYCGVITTASLLVQQESPKRCAMTMISTCAN